jgi:hypothetical protein
MTEEQKSSITIDITLSESEDASLKTFTETIDKNSKQATSLYKGKPLKLYLEFLTELTPYLKSGKDIKPYLEDIVKILIESKRYFDLATIRKFLKNHYDLNTETGKIYLLMKQVVSPYVNDVFTKSLTYSSSELDDMFANILGNDHALLMELISHIFKEYSLFNATLSENIYKKIIEIAASNLKGFIDHADTRFLAYYLSTMPKLPFTPPEHIAQWTSLIVSQSTNAKYTKKIIQAMKEHPSVDVLLIFIIAPREDERSEAISLLKDCVDMGMMDNEIYKNASIYFIEKALSGSFYDFNSFSGRQKEKFSSIMNVVGGSEVKKVAVNIVRDPNIHNDPKITETKKIFVNLLGKLFLKDHEIIVTLNQMLKDSSIEDTVKESISKVVSSVSGK